MADRPRDLAERMARRRKAAGKPGPSAGDGYLLPGTNVGALIARIGDDGPVFAVGSRHDIIADRSGTLFLAMNDHPQHNDQAGKVVAQVILLD